MRVDRVAVLDWSAAKGPRRGKDSIWLGVAGSAGVSTENLPTRTAAEARLRELAAEGRLLLGVDFALGYPAGFARRLTGQDSALALWDWLALRVRELPADGSNYRDIAAEANRAFPGHGPFWGNGERGETIGLPRTRPDLPPGLMAARATERAARAGGANPKSVWQLAGAGAVGAQALTGIPVLQRLRGAYPDQVAVWPFQDCAEARVVIAEIYPSLLADAVRADAGAVPDEVQVRLLSQALWHLAQAGRLGAAMTPEADPATLAAEGWILGVGAEAALRAALPTTPLTPPRLRNDCFAMPQGVEWVPVDAALERLRAGLSPVTLPESVPLAQAAGRVLAEAPVALRANPPAANAAVDGYGFAAATTGAGVQRLPLLAGRAAAGQPFAGVVPAGQAIRILTGAVLPEGVDTVVLEEDCATDGVTVAFDGPVKPRINTRRAGEDVAAGAALLPPGHRLRPPDLALLAATGIKDVQVRRRLRVAVLSTGDEIVQGAAAAPHQTHDANRPMLMALLAGWGHEVVDLGAAPDRARSIAARLDRGAARADAILTTGGASAGDEDHISRLLRERGQMQAWRIAMKPGRPLALALWQGVPVFGLPGNPVAALVCALVFARPALSVLAGGGWSEPQGFTVPAAFAKVKKAGRREYLRARLTEAGAAEVFASEGSGRISGLAWATGLVELPDGACEVRRGDPVRFLPYAGFGL
ncbi:MAG: molybdopterin-binding protein [Gemmobacter sp.]